MSSRDGTAAKGMESESEKGADCGRETVFSLGELDSDGIAPDVDQMRLCVGSECQSLGSPSPSSDSIGLLSLPWEMVTRIASHLPAQCIINVLPQVCRVLGEVCEDASAWQQRAQRLVGPGASFPVGPREEVDWASACLEMEQLLSLWSSMGERERGGVEGGGSEERGGVRAEGGREGGGGIGAGERDADRGGERNLPDGQEGARGEEEEPRAAEERLGGGLEEEQAQRQPGDGGEVEEERGEQQVGEGEVSDSAPVLERFSLPAGHIADVHSVLLFGGQGSLCATGSRDRNVNLWDLRGLSSGSRGRLLQTLGGLGGSGAHSGWVWCLAERGGLLASGAFDSTVRLWDLGTNGAPRGVIKGRAPVICLSWQPDALLAGSHDKKISVYDHRAPQPLVKTLQLHSSAVLSLVADERYIISGGKDNTIALYDRRASKLLNKITLGSFLLSMSLCDLEVWGGDNLGQIHTFSLQHGTLRPLAQFNVGHTHLVTGIHYSPGTLYTCSSDRTIRVHIPSAPPRTLCTMHNPTPVNGLSVESGVLAVASGNMAVEVWRPPQ